MGNYSTKPIHLLPSDTIITLPNTNIPVWQITNTVFLGILFIYIIKSILDDALIV